ASHRLRRPRFPPGLVTLTLAFQAPLASSGPVEAGLYPSSSLRQLPARHLRLLHPGRGYGIDQRETSSSPSGSCEEKSLFSFFSSTSSFCFLTSSLDSLPLVLP